MDGFPAADDGGLCAGRAATDECDGGRREPHAGEGWTVSFETTEGGALAMQLRGTEGETVDLGATQVDAGSGQLVWDGVLPDGSEAADGVYTVAVQLRNYWGEESEESLLPLTIGETNAAVSGVPDTLDLNSLDIQEAQIWEGGIEEAQVWDEGETANGGADGG